MDLGKYKDKKYVLRKIAQLIKTNPLSISSALENSNIYVKNYNDKIELAEKVAYALANNLQFQRNISIVLGANEAKVLGEITHENFSNLGGRGKVDSAKNAKYTGIKIAKGASGGKEPISIIIGAIIGAVDGAFSWGASKKRAKSDEERYRQELLGELFEEPKKSNMPLYIIGGVLLVGVVVIFFTLKK